MQITDLEPDDAAAIEQAAHALVIGFREQAPDAWPDLVEAHTEIHKALEPGKVCRIARDADGRVLGWIGGQHAYARVWELHSLVVIPIAQRRGIGRALVGDLEVQVRQRGGLTILLGRVTYQDWAPYWPTSTDEPYASHINTTPKYVVSTTLDTVEWGTYQTVNLITGNLADALGRLKQQPGKNIGTAGSPTLVHRLLQSNLLDELTLMIHPVVAGHGKRLFEGEGAQKRMKLVESKTTRSGVSILTYHPA